MSNKNPNFHTPVGRAVYPRLGRPDVKFHDLGIYKADLLVPLSEAKELLTKLSAIYAEHTGKAPNKVDNTMWKIELDEDGQMANEVMFKLRIKNRMGRDGEVWDRKPKLFDASLSPCNSVVPYGGSQMVVSFDAYCWDAGGKKGVSLQPVAVQIIKLETGDDNASSFGFAAAEGFTATEQAALEDASASLSSTSEEDDFAECDF